MHELSKLFGSATRLKLLRLFMFNHEKPLEIREVARRTRVPTESVRGELMKLKGIDFVKKKVFYKDEEVKGKSKRRKCSGWIFNPNFKYTEQLGEFLIETVPVEDREVLRKLRGTGTLKLVVVAGIFNKKFDSRVDLLIVGDRLRRQELENAIRSIEAELGKELHCTILSSHDFHYRMSVYDKLVRDVLDYPHRTIFDRLGVQRAATTTLLQ